MFRVLIYQRSNLQSGAIANLDVVKASISEDLSQRASSTITCVSIPTNVRVNDVLRLYDVKGNFIYWGVIDAITDNVLKCNQFQSLYNDNQYIIAYVPEYYATAKISEIIDWYLDSKEKGYATDYTEDGTTYYGILDKDVKNSYKGITHTLLDTSNREHMPMPSENGAINLEEFLYDVFNSYSRIVRPHWVSGSLNNLQNHLSQDLFTHDNQTIGIYQHLPLSSQHIDMLILNPIGRIELADGTVLDYSQTKLFDTYENISNLSITKADEDTNTLYLVSDQYGIYSAYTIKNDGTIVEIRNNVEIANRVGSNKTKFVAYDGTTNPMDIVYQNLPSLQYNHKITFDILFDDKNKYEDYILGKRIQFYENANNRLFDTMLTAWKYEIEENSDVIKKASFTLGKVRTSLTDKIKKRKLWYRN